MGTSVETRNFFELRLERTKSKNEEVRTDVRHEKTMPKSIREKSVDKKEVIRWQRKKES